MIDQMMSRVVCIFRVLSLPGSCLASGDENGLIKTWDWRAKSSISEFQAHSDFISDLKFHEAEQCLVAVSGDGSLSLNDLKTHKVGESSHMESVPIAKSNSSSHSRSLCQEYPPLHHKYVAKICKKQNLGSAPSYPIINSKYLVSLLSGLLHRFDISCSISSLKDLLIQLYPRSIRSLLIRATETVCHISL